MNSAVDQNVFLTVVLATVEDRAVGIDLDDLPVGSRWRYVIVCQQPAKQRNPDLEAWIAAITARRPDIEVTLLPGRGVAASRNAALASCETEALLFADDDVRLLASGIAGLIAELEADPGLDLIAGQTVLDSGAPEKPYPRHAGRLTVFNCARIGTVELAVRPRSIRDKHVHFDLAFGAGQTNFIGDEYVFVTDCLKTGLRGAYRPIAIAVHRGPSSGMDFHSDAAASARAQVFERVFGRIVALPVKLAFLWRHRSRLGSLQQAGHFASVFLGLHKG